MQNLSCDEYLNFAYRPVFCTFAWNENEVASNSLAIFESSYHTRSSAAGMSNAEISTGMFATSNVSTSLFPPSSVVTSRTGFVWFDTTQNIVRAKSTKNGVYLSPIDQNVTDCTGTVPLASGQMTSLSLSW